MKYIDILASFETEIDKIDNALEKPAVDDSLYWLNQAVGKFIKLRFDGDYTHGTGYELTEKRRLDLIKLFKTDTITSDQMKYTSEQPSYDQYLVEYPSDFLYILNEDVVITDSNGDNAMNTFVFECTQDSFMSRVNNSLTDFHYRFKRARPLRIRIDNGCKLLTDGNYKILQYDMGYLRKPNPINLQSPFDEYEDFEDIVMYEIIKIAALMYLENKKDERYQTISYEVNTQE